MNLPQVIDAFIAILVRADLRHFEIGEIIVAFGNLPNGDTIRANFPQPIVGFVSFEPDPIDTVLGDHQLPIQQEAVLFCRVA